MTRLILFDSSAFMHQAFRSMPNVQRRDGTPIGVVNYFCSTLWYLLGKFRHAGHFGVIGAAGGVTHRPRLYYKANYGPCDSKLTQQLAMVPAAVEAFGLQYVAVEGVEADDIIATYATWWTDPLLVPGDNRVVIVSCNLNFAQLVTDRVLIWNPVEEMLVGVQQVVLKFGVEPHQVVDWLAMVGDASDNVPGVPSIGPKTAAALLAACGNIDGIYENLNKLNARQQGVFLDHHITLRRSARLVTLRRDLPGLPVPERFRVQPINLGRLAAYCRSNGAEALAKRVETNSHQ